jgi:signal transduction histidine kinase
MNPKPRGQVDENASSTPVAGSENRAQELGTETPGALLATVAHRLSQPLTALRGTLELARLKARSVAEYRVAVEKALESADHLAWLLQELRELAEADVPEGEASLTNLAQVTRSVLEDLRPLAAARGVEIESRLEKGQQAQTYPEHLYQALLKVVHQAILRSPEGKMVRVTLRSVGEGAQWVIADEGPPFPFAESGLSLNILLAGRSFAGGCGESVLSLLTAKQFIEALAGSLSIQNSADRGGRVIIHLPARR